MSAALVEAVTKLADRIARLEKAAKTPERVSWRPREVAKRTGLSYEVVLELIHDGHLGAVQVGRLHLVPEREVQRLLGTGQIADDATARAS